ncbi:MAG TPA: alkaline phosphatase family protein [Verrucomicrobiae bacterium]|nr:alkaline phosphatase family protein [Verrucomicrobiae bacterium]
MAKDLSVIDTIIVVMMENRSFDHMLGYAAGIPPQYICNYNGAAYRPYPLANPNLPLPDDPPHDWKSIATQMGTLSQGEFSMDGFVTSYSAIHRINPGDQPIVMGYFGAPQVPMCDFFARNFAVCDHWFSSLPASTQPNRLMSMAGFTLINDNAIVLPDQDLVYDWLEGRGLRWRVYHEGLPFFALMPKWLPAIVGNDHFRPFGQFFRDVTEESDDEFPQVIFIEPTYTDAPHLGRSSDDHAPSPISPGQQFLLDAYRAASLDPGRWSRLVMVVTYDEHGGIFDHVTPPLVPTAPPAGANYGTPFNSLGVRVPSFVISPLVSKGRVHSGTLDHISILKFIGEKFGGGQGYSPVVDGRAVGSVSDVLDLTTPRNDVPSAPPLGDYAAGAPMDIGYTPGTPRSSINHAAFKGALDQMRRDHPVEAQQKFRDLLVHF